MSRREKRNKSRGSSGNNRKAGEDFLTRNGKKENVIETESGLQYSIIEEAEGNRPESSNTVLIHQRCQLLNGKIIIDTYKENEPSEVSMSELIDGYREGILLMTKGSRYKLFVPPDLAWGKKGSSSKIPPNAVLIFDVRLVDFW